MTEPRILNTRTAEVAPDDLVLHGANPRKGDLKAVTESFRANGFFGTVVVDERNEQVLAGNHRVMAARDLGMGAIPVTYVKPDSDEHALRILLADNRTSDLGTYDYDALAGLLDHLASTDDHLDGLGYDDSMLTAMAATVSADETGIKRKVDTTALWAEAGMPTYEETPDAPRLVIRFEDKATRDEFVEQHDIRITQGRENRVASAWWPEMPATYSSEGEGRHD